jgi:hypothetical protein
MSNFKLYLEDDSTGNIIDSVVVAAADEVHARNEALVYFSEHGGLDGVSLSASYEYTTEQPQVTAGSNATQRTF